jgi:hypothetical protein
MATLQAKAFSAAGLGFPDAVDAPRVGRFSVSFRGTPVTLNAGLCFLSLCGSWLWVPAISRVGLRSWRLG